MARGLYSALGRWPQQQLAEMRDVLRSLATRINAGDSVEAIGATLPEAARALIPGVVDAIRRFEAEVGRPTGLQANFVWTPQGDAIEVGNIGNHPFGHQHEATAA